MSKEGPSINEPKTEEEIKKFEEEHLTKDDQMRSEVRKNFYEAREDDKAEPNVRHEFRGEGDEREAILTAVIKGHKVEILGGVDGIKEGKIDNFILSESEAKDLVEKYRKLFGEFSVDAEEKEVQKILRAQAIQDVLGE